MRTCGGLWVVGCEEAARTALTPAASVYRIASLKLLAWGYLESHAPTELHADNQPFALNITTHSFVRCFLKYAQYHPELSRLH
jgi:hypothetical protein